MCLVGDAAAIHSDRVQQTRNKPASRSSCTLQAAPKEFAAAGAESVLGYFHMTAEREGANLIHG
jgi:hypothetical protein